MDGSLSISDVEKLVAQRAVQLDRAFTPDRVHVFEDPHSTDHGTLIVQIGARRPADRKSWTQLRLRLSQSIRDLLVERGDDRYPVVEVFGPEEWAGRND